MEIDILIAVTPQEIPSAIMTLSSVVLDCDVGCRVAVLMHGGIRRDFSSVDDFLSPSEIFDERDIRYPFSWHVTHEQKRLSFSSALDRVGQLKKNRLAALVFPGLGTNDEKWFGKIQQTFLKDPRNMLSIVLPFKNSSLHPVRAMPNAEEDGHMIMGGPDLPAILSACIGGEANFAHDLRIQAKKMGGNRWFLESIRHVYVEAEEPQGEKSAW